MMNLELIEKICKLSGVDVIERLPAHQLRNLTDGFQEDYLRLILQKGDTLETQRRIFTKLRESAEEFRVKTALAKVLDDLDLALNAYEERVEINNDSLQAIEEAYALKIAGKLYLDKYKDFHTRDGYRDHIVYEDWIIINGEGVVNWVEKWYKYNFMMDEFSQREIIKTALKESWCSTGVITNLCRLFRMLNTKRGKQLKQPTQEEETFFDWVDEESSRTEKIYGYLEYLQKRKDVINDYMGPSAPKQKPSNVNKTEAAIPETPLQVAEIIERYLPLPLSFAAGKHGKGHEEFDHTIQYVKEQKKWIGATKGFIYGVPTFCYVQKCSNAYPPYLRQGQWQTLNSGRWILSPYQSEDPTTEICIDEHINPKVVCGFAAYYASHLPEIYAARGNGAARVREMRETIREEYISISMDVFNCLVKREYQDALNEASFNEDVETEQDLRLKIESLAWRCFSCAESKYAFVDKEIDNTHFNGELSKRQKEFDKELFIRVEQELLRINLCRLKLVNEESTEKPGRIKLETTPDNQYRIKIKIPSTILSSTDDARSSSLLTDNFDKDSPKPAVLFTEEAMELWRKLQKAQMVDEHYQPMLSSLRKASLIAKEMGQRLNLRPLWEPFEILWGAKDLTNAYTQAFSSKYRKSLETKIRKALD